MARKSSKQVNEQNPEILVAEEPKKIREPVTVTDSSDVDDTQDHDEVPDSPNTTDDAGKDSKQRKPRTATNLQTILDTLQADNVKKGIKLLEAYIKRHGVGGQKRRSNKQVDENGEPKPLSAHKLFIQQEMKRIKEEQPDISTQERMKLATQRWKEHKEQ